MSRIEAMNSSEPLRLLACWLVLLQHAMDCADPARAREFAGRLAENLDQYPDGFRQSLRIELCIEAVQRQDLPTAEQHRLGGYETWAARSSLLEVEAEARLRHTLIDLVRS